MQRSLNARQEHLLATLCRSPRGEARLTNVDGRVLRPLRSRKFVAVMGSDNDTAVVTGAGRIYYEFFLQSPSPARNGAGGDEHAKRERIASNSSSGQTLRERLLSALGLLEQHLRPDAEIQLSKPGDGVDIRAYADDLVAALRRQVRSEF
jgi:hypothetical protein